jgi:WS/DGAT/MGAT family acyltransferase
MSPLLRMAPAALTFATDVLAPAKQSTATRFNAVVSPHRVFDTRRFGLDEFKRIRELVPGATVNDTVLAVCAGGLRRYLSGHGELPAADLPAIAPILIRDADSGGDDKPEVSWLRVQLGTHLADPVQRLAWIREQTASSQTIARAIAARELTNVNEHAPAATLAVTSKLLQHALIAPRNGASLACCTITNVPGPSVPLYLIGARMTYFSAILPIFDGMGLVFAVTSYDGRVIVSPTSCRELMPDPQRFTQCVRDSFQEYLALTVKSVRRRASASGRPSPKRRTARTGATSPRVAPAGRRRSTAPPH